MQVQDSDVSYFSMLGFGWLVNALCLLMNVSLSRSGTMSREMLQIASVVKLCQLEKEQGPDIQASELNRNRLDKVEKRFIKISIFVFLGQFIYVAAVVRYRIFISLIFWKTDNQTLSDS